jgi:uncharacterized protein YbaR (Trm112 family)
MMNLFDLLACPLCRVRLQLHPAACTCPDCGRSYPIIRGVPVFLPNPEESAAPENKSDLIIRNDYDPWIPKTIIQSLGKDQIILEVGCGNRALSIPNLIRLDVALTPYVDVVADIHALPFIPECLDFIFSMAVVEHLQNPFQASHSMFTALKDGGYIYHECNFVFTYHGYPSHFFNATAEGMKSIFSAFSIIRQGVAPYQMPSFALKNVLEGYIHHSRASESRPGLQVIRQLKEILDLDLLALDGYFTEKAAFNLAAGTYLVGQKKETPASTLIPPVLLNLWQSNQALQKRFPDVDRISLPDNILIWAQGEGKSRFPEINGFIDRVIPFDKDPHPEPVRPPETRGGERSEPYPAPDDNRPVSGPPETEGNPEGSEPEVPGGSGWTRSWKLGWAVLMNEGFRIFLGKLLRSWSRKLLY